MQSVCSHHHAIVLLLCIAFMSENFHEMRCIGCLCVHWHASQPGSSIAQNLMSVAGAAAALASICACAAAAAFSSADIATPPPDAPLDTALRRPDCTVDFSACVALVVRR